MGPAQARSEMQADYKGDGYKLVEPLQAHLLLLKVPVSRTAIRRIRLGRSCPAAPPVLLACIRGCHRSTPARQARCDKVSPSHTAEIAVVASGEWITRSDWGPIRYPSCHS